MILLSMLLYSTNSMAVWAQLFQLRFFTSAMHMALSKLHHPCFWYVCAYFVLHKMRVWDIYTVKGYYMKCTYVITFNVRLIINNHSNNLINHCTFCFLKFIEYVLYLYFTSGSLQGTRQVCCSVFWFESVILPWDTTLLKNMWWNTWQR